MTITLLMSSKTLVLHPSIFTLELLLATRQLKTLEISFTKVRLKIFEPFLFKWSLPLLRWFGFIFFEWSIRYIFLSWHNWDKIRLTLHLFAFNFELSVLRIILETLTSCWLFFNEVARSTISFSMTLKFDWYDLKSWQKHLNVLRTIRACNMKWKSFFMYFKRSSIKE